MVPQSQISGWLSWLLLTPASSSRLGLICILRCGTKEKQSIQSIIFYFNVNKVIFRKAACQAYCFANTIKMQLRVLISTCQIHCETIVQLQLHIPYMCLYTLLQHNCELILELQHTATHTTYEHTFAHAIICGQPSVLHNTQHPTFYNACCKRLHTRYNINRFRIHE